MQAPIFSIRGILLSKSLIIQSMPELTLIFEKQYKHVRQYTNINLLQ